MSGSSRRVLIWGGGGHGKVVADVVRAAGCMVVGYVDQDPAKINHWEGPEGGRLVLSQQAFLTGIRKRGACPAGIAAAVLAIGNNGTRQECLRQLGTLESPALVHPSATVSPSASIGRGSVVFPGAVVNANARIGDTVIVNSGAIIEHDCVLADAVHVSPGARWAGAYG